MSNRSGNKNKALEIQFPASLRKPLEEAIAFAGNLTDYYDEVEGKLKLQDLQILFIDDQWEIPQLVGVDSNKQVVMLVTRIATDDHIGEGEILVSNQDLSLILHITYYSGEKEFYDICMDLIRGNFSSFRWSSFLYDEQGKYEGQLIVERLEGDIPTDMITIRRDKISVD